MSQRVSGLGALKAALYSTVLAYVLLGALSPFTADAGLSLPAIACRQLLLFFALAALGVVLLPRLPLYKLGLGLVLFSVLVETVRSVFTGVSDPLHLAYAAAGILVALAPVVIGRAWPLQSTGSAPTSINFLL
jgi:hypothetical protein